MSLVKRNQGCSSGFQLYNSGVLVENPSHTQKQTGGEVSIDLINDYRLIGMEW